MNTLLAMFYSDVMSRTLRSSAFYRQWEAAFLSARGKTWDELQTAAAVLAEQEGYLAFLTALRLGILLGAELEELSPSDY